MVKGNVRRASSLSRRYSPQWSSIWVAVSALYFQQIMKVFSTGHQLHIATKVPTQKTRATHNDFGLTEKESLNIIVRST